VPTVLEGISTWLCFRLASRGGDWLSETTLSVIERLSGFLLAAIAVEMMAAGIKTLFLGVPGN
jgi:multiple antibiotic resistance protein